MKDPTMKMKKKINKMQLPLWLPIETIKMN